MEQPTGDEPITLHHFSLGDPPSAINREGGSYLASLLVSDGFLTRDRMLAPHIRSRGIRYTSFGM